jgi:hypothetical protein
VHCVVRSPPFFRIRDYAMPAQIGQEATPADYADTLAEVFADIRRVLRDDGFGLAATR